MRFGLGMWVGGLLLVFGLSACGNGSRLRDQMAKSSTTSKSGTETDSADQGSEGTGPNAIPPAPRLVCADRTLSTLDSTGNGTCAQLNSLCLGVTAASGSRALYCESASQSGEPSVYGPYRARCCRLENLPTANGLAFRNEIVPHAQTGAAVCSAVGGLATLSVASSGLQAVYSTTAPAIADPQSTLSWKTRCLGSNGATLRDASAFVPPGASGDQVCAAAGLTCLNVLAGSGTLHHYCETTNSLPSTTVMKAQCLGI